MSSDTGKTPDNRSDDEFFSVGAPLHAVRAGYVRRRADDLLTEAVLAGRYAHVIAPDRTGKSSLIAGAAARLENSSVNVAILDLSQIGTRETGTDAGRWYYSVAYRMLRQLRIRFELQDWWQDKSFLTNRQRLVEFYSEIVLPNLQERVVIFIDAIDTVGAVGEQLLVSVRAAYNARATDPDFSRLTFVLLGEGDPTSLVAEPDLSPFSITQQIPLDDFSREDINLYAAELNLDGDAAQHVLDRIYFWTSGQPYLTQKLARAVSRDPPAGDYDEAVDKLVVQQLAGRAATRNEPNMSHIHRALVDDSKNKEALLNLYGRIRKGVSVPTDLGSAEQRKLIAIGLLVVDEHGSLKVRNRLYEAVFTARWANENLPAHWKGPAIAAGIILLMLAIPFWYTQLLPKPYVAVLNSGTVDLQTAQTTWLNLRSFPGHTDVADSVYVSFLSARADAATTELEIVEISSMAVVVGEDTRLSEQLTAKFWDRQVLEALSLEKRDAALLSSIKSFELSTRERRNRASMLIASDYPLLVAGLPAGESAGSRFDSVNQVINRIDGSTVQQWTSGPLGLQRGEPWSMTALEVTPLVRRLAVDKEGTVRRIGLTLNLSHPRMSDLRIKLIAPSGRTVIVDPGVDRASSNQDLRIPSRQLRDLSGEDLAGTWSISLRDEELGVAGRLVGWNLTLNSQVIVEDFQRGLNISDPVERPTETIWLGPKGRYAVARAAQSDSARIWDLAFAKPIRALALDANEEIVGIDSVAARLVTATQESVHIWNVSTGKQETSLPIDSGSLSMRILADDVHLLVRTLGDTDTVFDLWSLDLARKVNSIAVAGTPALDSVSADGSKIAVADFDRAVRVWDTNSGDLYAQIDLPAQPDRIELSSGGDVLAAVFRSGGISLWNTAATDSALYEEFSDGDWNFVFSRSGALILAGTPQTGYQVRSSTDGHLIGPLIGIGATDALAISDDEQIVFTADAEAGARLWRIPTESDSFKLGEHSIWSPAMDGVVDVTSDASMVVTADRSGHVHMLDVAKGMQSLSDATEEISYIGHNAPIRHLAIAGTGDLVASIGDDDQIRYWSIETGLPTRYVTDINASDVRKMEFSPNGQQLAVLTGLGITIIDTSNGNVLDELELGEEHLDFSFAANDLLYVGSASGTLRSIRRNDAGNRDIQQLWSTTAPLQKLVTSPDSNILVIADAENRIHQFSISENRIGSKTVQLPDSVQDLSYSPVGFRVLARTSRWVHQLTSLDDGLQWNDALLTPKVLHGAPIVYGDRQSFFLPVALDGDVRLASFRFRDTEQPGLFGSRAKLLEEWEARLSRRGDSLP